MKFKVNEHIDLEEEIIEYLTEKHNPLMFDAIKQYQEADADIKEFYKVGADVKKYLDSVKFTKTKVSELLFTMDSDNPMNVAGILKYTRGKRELLLNAIEDIYDLENFESEAQLQEWLYHSDLDVKLKYDITALLLDFDYLYSELIQNIERYRDCEADLNKLFEPYLQSYLSSMSEDDETLPLSKELGFDLNSAHSVVVYPFIGQPTRYKGMATRNVDKDHTIDFSVYVGVSVFDVLKIRNSSDNRERRVQKVLKIMSEKTKYDILKLCLDKEYYGGELAKSLGLSGATVSHHVNELAEEQLLSMTVDKNRVYYRTNRKNLIKVFHEAIKLFEEK